MKLILLHMFMPFLIVGCATSSIPATEAKLVPAEQIFLRIPPSENNIRVVFVRDTGVYGSGMFKHIYIDGKKAASLNAGEKAEFSLPQGEHIFGVIPTDPWNQFNIESIDQDLKIGRTYFYRIQTNPHSLNPPLQRFLPR